MASNPVEGSTDAERLSALVDGELDEAALAETCFEWAHEAQARMRWHAYQVIGDVLRSDDLATGVCHDEQFLVSLRARLADEPVIVAPAPLSTPPLPLRASMSVTRPLPRWTIPSAIAAGVVLVVGTFTVLRPLEPAPSGAAPVAVAEATPPAAVASPLQAASIREPVEPEAIIVDGKMIHDARLDRYLAAHKQFSGSSALGLPSAFLRAATVEADAR
ncbi:MAG TPA: RseA family anti-sigma factor [Caldimonas sp.]|nr:RseA family anti-sigma factor [Caldimonas sp.]